MTPPELVELATRHQVLLERVKSGYVRDFAMQFQKLERQIVIELSKLRVDTMNQLTRRQLKNTMHSIRQIQQKLVNEAVDKFYPQLEELSGYEVQFEAKSLERVVRTSSYRLNAIAAQAAYRKALTHPLSATGELLEPFIKHIGTRQHQKIDNMLRQSWGEGWTVQRAVQGIRGTRAANFQDGIIKSTTRQAEAVVRTATQHISGTARTALWEANSDIVTGYRFVATLDMRTTVKCRSLDGRVFKLGKGPTPPVHINCRSTTAADLDNRYSILDDDATRASMDGQVDTKQTYYGWLKGQDADFQDAAIGPSRGKLLRSGGLSTERFAQLNLGRNFEPLTLKQMQSLEPTAFKRAGVSP